VAVLDGFLSFVQEEYLGGVGLAGVQVGQQCVPAVGGGFGVDGLLVEVPAEGWFPVSGLVPVWVRR
jgi:hypothetical protein